jgi:hypothetical protein
LGFVTKCFAGACPHCEPLIVTATEQTEEANMNIEIHAGGKVTLGIPQQRWSDSDTINPGLLETAKFAGQEMMAITDDAGGFQLLYLGFKAEGFKSMTLAKASAPEFARRVLARMAEMIAS